ncbi:MAG: hypothetical protein NT076_00150 [Candidatus Pacearchaeota archaeon]|nr:hypothetical protein [Candidatus Pacearchaeota archaeon]
MTYLVYEADKGKPSRDRIIADLYKGMERRSKVALELKVTRHPDYVPLGEKAQICLRETLEVAGSGFLFHDSTKILPRDCNPVDVTLNPAAVRVEMFFYSLAG